MKVLLRQDVIENDFNSFEAKITAVNESGETLFEVTEPYLGCNVIYAAYKSLLKAINRLPRYGVDRFDLQSNVDEMVKELHGRENIHTRLLGIFKSRLETKRVQIENIKLSA
jgi:hypothetical protein